jgi:general secretion pathway protein G
MTINYRAIGLLRYRAIGILRHRAHRRRLGIAQYPNNSIPQYQASSPGWTLIELLIVISLIMILASVALAAYRNSVVSAKESVLRSNLWHMREAIDQYYADKGKYPDSLESLVSELYLRAIPKDPFTQSTDTWQTTQADSQPGSLSATAGIYDVKSGSDGTALDGTRYAEWH